MTGRTTIVVSANRSTPAIGYLRVRGLRVLGLAAVLGLARTGGADAFPLFDATNQDQVPQGTELAAPDVADLQHQLQIVNGLAAPVGGGWTFVPRIDFQELLTDNIEQAHSPRQWDLVTYFAPGFNLAGDLPRIQMTLSYQPTLALYAETSSLNAITQNLNGLASVTLVPDILYVDLRAVSGVSSVYGGIGGLGGLGAPAGAGATAGTAIPTLAGNAQGLTRNNEVQTTSFGISPYLVQSFGDWGSGRVGYSFNVTHSGTLSGFASPPIPSGGANAQTLISNEETAHFVTGDIMQFLQNSIDADVVTSTTTTSADGATIPGTEFIAPNGTVQSLSAPPGQSTSSRIVVTDRVSYAVSHDLVLFATGGHEDIVYSNQALSGLTATVTPSGAVIPSFVFTNVPGTSIHDMVWNIGGTWTPTPDTSLTLSYGHQNGYNSFSANGYYQATARTLVTVSYGSTLGTQLEYVQNQLALAANNGSGTPVNGLTGGNGLFGATNALAAQDGLFRTDTFTLGTNTSLDRDIISFNLLFTKQTTTGSTASSGTSNGFNASWLHQMRPDMTVSAGFAFASQGQATFNGGNPNNSSSVAASLAWQYQISDTVSVSLRYSFLDRWSQSTVYDMYQNLVILGISKTF
jgi:hypothetical protein